MPNPHRGLVEIEIGDKKRALRYNLNAFAEIQERFGAKNMDEFLAGVGQRLGFAEIRFMLWIGLHHNHEGGDPELTEHDVGDWQFDVQAVSETLFKAIKIGFRGGQEEEEDEEDEDPTKTEESPESTSTPSQSSVTEI